MLSAGVVIIHRKDGHCRYLLLRCFRHWDFPKGMVEPGELPLDAACREVVEETSLAVLDFEWQHEFIETPPYGPGKVARYYVASVATDEIELPISLELGKPENDEFRWLEYHDARSLLSPRIVRVLDWAHQLTGC